MYQENDSSGSIEIGYDIKKYNGSSNRWIECNDIKAEDFDIITSRISHVTEKNIARKYQWNIIIKNINVSFNYIAKFLKRGKEKDTYRELFHKHRKRNEFFLYDVEDVGRTKRLDAEREWFKKEYARQVGKPKPQDEEILMKKATNGLILKSKCIPFERICYAPPLQHVSKLDQVNWRDTPLAIACTCPADLCTCSSRKISILPPAKIPCKRRVTCFGIKSFCWAIRVMKYPKPAGTLIPKLVEVVKTEAEYYASPKGRRELKAKGPEFCMSGCLQYLVSSLAVDAALAAEIAMMQAKVDVGGLGMLMEGEEAWESVSEQVCDEFSCSVATQTENDPETGELLIGDYSSVLYGSIYDSIMNDVEGMKLQISTYSYEPPDPCAFSFNKILHVKEIKQHISKIKEMYSTISAARESYCCNDVSCQFKGLTFIESLGSMLGKCKCKSTSNKKEDIEKNKKIEEAAGDLVPEEDVYVCPSLLERIVEIKGEVNNIFRKYFKRNEAPHPCRKKSLSEPMDRNGKQETELKETDKNKVHKTLYRVAENNMKPEIPIKEIGKNTIKETLKEINKNINPELGLKVTDNIKGAALDIVYNIRKQDTLLKATEKLEETASKIKDKDTMLEIVLTEIGQDVKEDIELKVNDNNVIKDAAFDFIDNNLGQNTGSISIVVGSSNVSKKVNSAKEVQNDKKIKSCSCLEKAKDRNKLHYHKAVECCVDKNRYDKKAIASPLNQMTYVIDRNKVKGSDKNVVKSQPDSGDKLNDTDIKNTEEDIIKDVHKTSVINFVKNIRSSSSKSSSIESKRSTINKLNKSLLINSQSENKSEEFNSTGVFPMISKKVSNSGWKGWFSFLTEKDKNMSVSDKKKSKSNMRVQGKVESKEKAVKKYNTIVKKLDRSVSDSHSYCADEVVQNVESLRHLNSCQTAVNGTIKSQANEQVMPKYYRFYY